ncbi:MAG TPA: class D sortase [Bacillota bacterium]|nr:class D sortase [Bacillota bacterium]
MRSEKNRERKRKYLAAGLVLSGILIMVYPHAAQVYNDYRMQSLLNDIERSVSQSGALPEDRTTVRYRDLTELFEDVGQGEDQLPDEQAPQPQPDPTPVDPPPPPPKPTGALLGTISIEKISVRMPVFYGATDANMAIGAGLIEGTSAIGEIGNAAIAAHRSRKYGRQFNRLDEMEPGDLIIVETAARKFTYRVYKKHIVLPTDISVLNRSRTHAVLTLVTCEPIYPATHRLIIHAVLIDE